MVTQQGEAFQRRDQSLPFSQYSLMGLWRWLPLLRKINRKPVACSIYAFTEDKNGSIAICFFSPVNASNFKGTNLPIPHLPDTYTLNENCELSALCISWKTFKNQPHQQPNDLIISTEASNLLKNVSLDIRIQITYCLVFCRDVFFGVLCVYIRIHACTRVYFVGLNDH